MLPGLCGEISPVANRLFLGTQPTMAVEQRLLRQMQVVYPWLASRKRVKEAGTEFMEIDLASIDAELLLRYNHVFFARRQIHDELIEKQLTLLESSKPPKAAEVAITQGLTDIHRAAAKRIYHEINELQALKPTCTVSGRRELEPSAAFQSYDILTMMRVAEENAAPELSHVESQCRAFLPADRVHDSAAALAREIFATEGEAKAQLDKKELKLWSRHNAPDYNKIGCVAKYRPLEVAAYYRFFGERIVSTNSGFRRSLWGNLFRKMATTPSYLTSISRYWALHSGLDAQGRSGAPSTIPSNIASAACEHDKMFRGLQFRNLFMYSSIEVARQTWRVDNFVPLMRLFPLMGQQASDEALAFLLVEDFWATLTNSESSIVINDAIIRASKQFVEDNALLHDSNIDGLLNKAQSSAARVLPEPSVVASGNSEESAATFSEPAVSA
ncbi:Hypothetical protein, putative [Bodo saltans]|uniref:Uncharacterized protein n=1 Tax=Bodo saltans TaxID=75058 RepID=A0A0S4IPF0_BODSA|nr:Hypothetical protein, putative [Bodo saltans]|eukprot:CUF84596.1 Hypothetical protein, putative [Bodo saltans]